MDCREKPLLIFDGDCGFCRAWITRWKSRTGDRVEYAPYQTAAEHCPEVPVDRFRQAAHLVDTDGRVYAGAEAVFRTLMYAGGHGVGLWFFRRFPGFAAVCNLVYWLVARNRSTLSRLMRLFWGDYSVQPSYFLTRWLFLRLLGVVYLIAFLSLGSQVVGLVGQHGITPASQYLQRAHGALGTEAYLRVPTLCWWNSSDVFLRALCWAGAGLSILLILGVAPLPVLILLWAYYLSLTSIGSVFLHFQWDALLLETGLLAVFFAPLGLFPRLGKESPPSRIMLLLLRLLLFKLMFLSGVVKLQSGADNPADTWRNFTALNYHYETQPLPVWTSWYAHHLPFWFQKFSLIVMFTIELVVPFLILGPRRLRMFAGFCTVFFMFLIALTGNYTFFNLLTVALCVCCFDDLCLRRLLPARLSSALDRPRPRPRWLGARAFLHAPVAIFIGGISFAVSCQRTKPDWRFPPWVIAIRQWISPFNSISAYGLFANMTTVRNEIVIEGSEDGLHWKEYEFYWKPGDVTRRPRFVQPHQPRVDWQMWFAALGNYRHQRNAWFNGLLQRVLEDRPEVLAFFRVNPFADAPPKYIRAQLYRYRFSDPPTRAQAGAWWTREYVGQYCPTLAR